MRIAFRLRNQSSRLSQLRPTHLHLISCEQDAAGRLGQDVWTILGFSTAKSCDHFYLLIQAAACGQTPYSNSFHVSIALKTVPIDCNWREFSPAPLISQALTPPLPMATTMSAQSSLSAGFFRSEPDAERSICSDW